MIFICGRYFAIVRAVVPLAVEAIMAGARKFSLGEITRDDIYAANRETAQQTGITYITDKNDDEAKKVIREKGKVTASK